MLDRASRWLSSPANLTFAVGLGGILFTLIFWAITNRFEPTFVATFGTMLTASGLLASRQAQPPDVPERTRPDPEPRR